jgi:tetratricopeptide (TPR) repeat protein
MDNPPETSQSLSAQRDAEANQYLLRGLALLETNTPASLTEAVHCFDQAIELRRQLPLAAQPWFRYGLIAGFLNRGDALTRLGSVENLAAAVAAYDESLMQLRELPMTESPLFVKRLAIAWLNRGITLLRQKLPDTISRAADSFSEAIAAAKNFHALAPEEGRTLLAGAWVNRANALIQSQPPQAGPARVAARTALAFCVEVEKENVAATEISLQARHILCQALAQLLSDPNADDTTRAGWLAEATEAVDGGMALARHWEARDARQFHAAATDLFRFGCRVYQIHQPHFLTEFLLENLDPAYSSDAFRADATLHASAAEALWRSLVGLQRDGFKSMNTPQFEKMLAQLQELRITGERLTELRRVMGSA